MLDETSTYSMTIREAAEELAVALGCGPVEVIASRIVAAIERERKVEESLADVLPPQTDPAPNRHERRATAAKRR